MARWVLSLTLVMGTSVASAASAQTAQPQLATSLNAVVESAELSAKVAERRVAQLALYRGQLAKRYQDQLNAIDRLKKQRASWRLDRELRESMSSSLETANQLTASTRELDAARQHLVNARRTYLIAIDGELGTGPVPARRQALERARRALVPQLRDVPHRIVLPDLDVDLLADPEELDQHAAELRATEGELAREVAGLEAQAVALDHLAQLRKQHDRAGDLFNRDDDQPHRNTVRKTDGNEDTTGTGGQWDNPHSPSTPPGVTPISAENYVPIVLADVIDASTISTFAAAERSGDPAQRAAAAHKAHDAVAKRIDQVRKKRAEIEARARQLRAVH